MPPAETPSDEPESGTEPTASEILRSLAGGEGGAIPFSAFVESAGSRIHGLALLLLVLPEVPPIPLPSASAVLGIPLVIISSHLALFGEGSLLPARLQSVAVPRSVVVAAARYLSPLLSWLERASKPRWSGLARRERLIGWFCLYLSVVLLLPIPLMNALPAMCLATIALGMIQRDGLFIAAGMAGGVLMTAAAVGAIDVASSFFAR